MTTSVINVKGVDTTVYGDLTGAGAYLAGAVHGASWAALDSATKKAAMITATRILERLAWDGQPTETVDKTLPQPADTQPLQWPRTGLLDRNGLALDDSTIPDDVVSAAYEIAFALTVTDATIQTQASGSNVKSEELTERVEGAITVTEKKSYFRSTQGETGRFPRIIHELIGLWTGALAQILPEVSGICESTTPETFGFSPNGLP